MRYFMIAIGGALGSLARYQIGTFIQLRTPGMFPWGTFVVNVTGCLLMGAVYTIIADYTSLSPQWRYLIPIGFIGAYTTFSTFELDVFLANSDGMRALGLLYVVASLVVGYAALWTGTVVARWI